MFKYWGMCMRAVRFHFGVAQFQADDDNFLKRDNNLR